MRKVAAMLGLVLLAGCGGTRQPVPTSVHVRLVNYGTEWASGEAGSWEKQDDFKFNLAPGETKKFVVEVDYRLKVRIWRTSDNLVLVDDFWDYSDLFGKDELLITVSP